MPRYTGGVLEDELADGRIGVIVVDHGSRREASNRWLERIADELASAAGWSVVEPAHMELAEPSIATAFARCVDRGARRVVVLPYFLLPGRHWREDIPRLVAEAATAYPEVAYRVVAPVGIHPQMQRVMAATVAGCLADDGALCEVCMADERCRFTTAAEDGGGENDTE
jgi:sirohydrochlorin ferrochelatase